MYIYENIIQDLPPHCYNTKKHLGFEGGGPGASALYKIVKRVVELNRRREAETAARLLDPACHW